MRGGIRMTKEKERGFTLIELITVIIILALLAVFAIPRYITMLSEGRKSTILGVEAALQSSVALVKARAKLEGDSGAGSVTVENGLGGTASVTTTSQLIPVGTSAGIGAAIDLRDTQAKVTVTYTTPAGSQVATYAAAGASGTCEAVYTETTATGVVSIATTLTGC